MAQDPKEIVLQHGEKIALGLVALAAGFVVLTSGEMQSLSDRIKAAQVKITDKVGKGLNDADLQKVVDPQPALMAPLAPMTVSIPDNLPWTYYRKPLVEITRTPGPQPIVAPNLPENSIRATGSREKIEVSWDRPPGRGVDPVDKVERSAARLLGFQLIKIRKGQEDKPESMYFDSGTTSWSDSKFDSETSYSYRVRAYWEFKLEGKPAETPETHPCEKVTEHVLEDGPLKGKTVWVTTWSTTVSVTTALNIGLAFSSRSGEDATMSVWQFRNGDWWRVVFKVKIGDDIGGLVSMKMLVEDKYNKDTHSSKAAYRDMLDVQTKNKAKFEKAEIPWQSRYVYFGQIREKSEEFVLLEHHEVPMRGASGLDWGTKVVKFAKTKGDVPPEGSGAPTPPKETGKGSGS